jgi:hypothetical protein
VLEVAWRWPNIQVIVHAHNKVASAALLTELYTATGDSVVVLDADLSYGTRTNRHALDGTWSVSGETMAVESENHAYNHIFAMEHVTRERIDALITDLAQPGSLLPNNPSPITPAHASAVISETAGVLIHVPHAGRGFR